MRRLALAGAAMICLTGFTRAAGEQPFWLSGRWVHEDKARASWTEESWLSRGGMMVGVGVSGTGDAVKSFEYMRIERDKDGRMTFWGSPQGQTPVPFRMTSLTSEEVVFENRAHDYPQRIAYRREGAALIATISLADRSKPVSWRYESACAGQNGRLSTARAP